MSVCHHVTRVCELDLKPHPHPDIQDHFWLFHCKLTFRLVERSSFHYRSVAEDESAPHHCKYRRTVPADVSTTGNVEKVVQPIFALHYFKQRLDGTMHIIPSLTHPVRQTLSPCVVTDCLGGRDFAPP